ncbi:MAG: glycosyl hydrolase family 39 [Acidobacteriota bacterium]
MKMHGMYLALGAAGVLACAGVAAQTPTTAVRVNWAKPVTTSRSTPTLQVVVNPQLMRGAKMHDGSFAALHLMGADYVRYVPWLPYPKLAVAELEPPTGAKTSWDFSKIDPMLDDFMKATEGHSVILNFSTIPAWMFKVKKPVTYPADATEVYWHYTQGSELRDPSMKEVADYYARLLQWYTRGGFTDENGKRWESGHHYKVAYWEILNEIDLEHHWSPEAYTKFYDAVAMAMRKVDPQIKFVGLALAYPGKAPEMMEYFLNPAHHAAGVPLDFISYHFYAQPLAGENVEDWQYTFFDQADGFMNTIRYVEAIRKRLSPETKTDLDEIGSILPGDGEENGKPGFVATAEPKEYWNLTGAMFAYLYLETAKVGIDVVGESQLVGYHSQFPSVSMMNYNTSEPNARFWVLKLLKDNFGPGDVLATTSNPEKTLEVQAFTTGNGKKLLVINKRNRAVQISLPADAAGASVAMVAPSTGDHAPTESTLSGLKLSLEPFEVAVVRYK